MLVVAFDGLLFDTFGSRARAVVEALGHEGVRADIAKVLQVLPSRSIAETVRAVVAPQTENRRSLAHNIDETSLDLAVLRAERSLSALNSSGVVLSMKLAERIRSAASVTRIVVRADSRRREVEELLRLTELDPLLAMTRCSDDAAGVPRVENESTLRRSYAQIVARMAANRNLLGNAAGIGIALEHSELARQVAREFGFEAPDDVESFAVPGV
ncbi:MAG: hypothetical protein H7Z40_14310, partial [Phycisphaerae bacterium]|nr:hypothetical protein [Gemmatimonadaceae bacterium]